MSAGLLCNALDLEQLVRALQRPRGQLARACRGNQGGFGLHQIGALDIKQRLALGHVVADLGVHVADLALIGSEDLHRAVFIEVDVADRITLVGELVLFHGGHLDVRALRLAQRYPLLPACCRIRGGFAGSLAGLRLFVYRRGLRAPRKREHQAGYGNSGGGAPHGGGFCIETHDKPPRLQKLPA
jgi:hypothetical protein